MESNINTHPPTPEKPDKLRTDPDRLPGEPGAAASEGSGVAGDALRNGNSADVGFLTPQGDLDTTNFGSGLPLDAEHEDDNRAVTPSDGTGVSGTAHDPDDPS